MRTLLVLAFSLTLLIGRSQAYKGIITGAERTGAYLPLIRDLRVGIVANRTSRIGETHLLDSLLTLGISLNVIFSPEHGFRGDLGDGIAVADGIDPRTGIRVISLYGRKKKPEPSDLKGIDMIIFDIQDVGVRYYTYVSTLHYVMEACAEQNVRLLILDRPNPNGFYVDGPLLEEKHRSFVGMHPVPVVPGMTIAEYGRMINGEGWLAGGLKCDLMWVPCLGYDHSRKYTLPVRPSPNLPNMNAVYLYPSLCFFEGTVISVGRGTDFPFEVFGHPDLPGRDFSFTPESRPDAAPNPRLEGKVCYGTDLRGLRQSGSFREGRINLQWLISAYSRYPDKDTFFNPYFEKLAGNDSLRIQVTSGWTEQMIRESWEKDLDGFRSIRQKYLLYPDTRQPGS